MNFLHLEDYSNSQKMKSYLNFILFLIITSSTNLFGQSISVSLEHPDPHAWVSIYFENTETSENFSFNHSAEYVYDHDGFEVGLPVGTYFYHVNYHSPHSCNGIRISNTNSEINSKDDCGDINLNGDLSSTGEAFSVSLEHPDPHAWVSVYFENTQTSENFSFNHSAEYVYDHDGFEVELPAGDYFYHINYHSPHSCNGIRISDGDSEINSKDDCGDINLNGEVTIGVLGCKDPLATNYNPEATLDDESCVICTPGSYGEDGVCIACPEGTFSSSSAALVCTNTSICSADEFESVAPTATSDRVCSALSSCTAEEYESVAATSTSDRVCSTLSVCSSDEYESVAATVSSNRLCSALSVCSSDEYISVAATTTSDRICETIIEGCTDATAYNFNSDANTDDGSCDALVLPAGWSMFGYTCLESKDVIEAFEGWEEQIEIVKNELGLAYLPVYNYNAIGDLKFSEGYQIKLKEKLVGFKFCTPVGQHHVEAAYAEGVASVTPEDGINQEHVDSAYEEGVSSVVPEDGINQSTLDSVIESYADWLAPVYGCTDQDNCVYNPLANVDDGSCIYPDAGYDCDGNIMVGARIEGGIVFYVDHTGQHGLVASMTDVGGSFSWSQAHSAAEGVSTGGYNDWFLPSLEQLELMYNRVGPGGTLNNVGNFLYQRYWSSTVCDYSWCDSGAGGYIDFANGYEDINPYPLLQIRVRPIRSF